MKKKILLIDDDDMTTELYFTILQSDSRSVEIAKTFIEGKQRLKNDDYDLLIVDINLPDGNGIDLILPYKNKSNNDNVLVFSGQELDCNSLREKTGTALQCLSKRTPVTTVVEMVDKLI